MASESTILVPNVLTDVRSVERLYASITEAPPAEQYVFDMSAVGFVKPYGVIALVSAARQLSSLSGHPVRLENLAGDIQAYLDRIDLFDVGSDWLQPSATLDEEWSRNPQTVNLLELTPITGPEDVTTIASRAHRVFSYWLTIKNLNSLLSVLSELCANVYQHSGDLQGCVLIQKYEADMRGQRDGKTPMISAHEYAVVRSAFTSARAPKR